MLEKNKIYSQQDILSDIQKIKLCSKENDSKNLCDAFNQTKQKQKANKFFSVAYQVILLKHNIFLNELDQSKKSISH